MSAGNLAVTCLLLVCGQLPEDVVPSKARGFRLPITVKPALRGNVREQLLYYSSDQGKVWHEVNKVGPEVDSFVFHAPEDGLYWFRVAAVTLQGKQEPERIDLGPPEQKVLVDTRKPDLQITARREGQELVVNWEAMDANPDPRSLLLEYQVVDSPTAPWTAVNLPTPPPAKGEARTPCNSPATIAVRAQVKDLVGNLTSAEYKIPGTSEVKVVSLPRDQTPNSSGGLPLPHPIGGGQPPRTQGTEIVPPPPSNLGQQLVQTNGNSAPIQAQPMRSPNETFGNAGTVSPGTAGTNYVAAMPVRQQHPSAQQGPSAPNPVAPVSGRRPLAPAKLVNDRGIIVEYELSKVGPSGIKSVELFLTQDDGQKWVKFADDEYAKSATAGTKYQRSLELPVGDGIYGLYLVVRNGAGRGKPPPRSGDAPEMRIEVDTTAPQAQLNLPPVADPERPDALLLTWQAKDKNLGTGPISLDWSEKRDGPWHPIGANLPNTGRHSWQVPAGVPVEVYLRLRVRDNAGNEAVAITNGPEIVDLTVPEGQIIGATPAGHSQ